MMMIDHLSAALGRIAPSATLAMSGRVIDLKSQGIDVMVSSPDQMRQRGLEDLKRWGDIIRTAGIKVD